MNKLLPNEKRAFAFIVIAVVLNALSNSLFSQQDIIGKKSLGGTDGHVTILTMLMPVTSLFSIWWGRFLENSHRKERAFLIIAIGGRLLLLFGFWIVNVYQYILLMGIVHIFNSLYSPAQNALLQSNFRKETIGKIFGIISSANTLFTIPLIYYLGKYLDYNEMNFRNIMLGAAISGFLGILFLYFTGFHKKHKDFTEKIPFRKIFLEPLQRSVQILKINKDFRVFEINYLIYGIGFMVILPAIPKYFVDILGLSYSDIFFAKGIIAQIIIIILTPFTGRLFSKDRPELFTAVSFGILTLYPLSFFISSLLHGQLAIWFVYGAYIFFGIGMSGIIISWSLGSIYFAGKEDVSMYQSVHVAMVGLRGLIMPTIGYFLIKLLGVKPIFLISFFGFLTASISSFLYYKRSIK